MAATYRRRGNTTNINRTRTCYWTQTGSRFTGTARGTTSGTRGNYTGLRDNFQQKIDSYRTLYGETQGTTGAGRPSPTALNTFANWVNKGAVIHKVSPIQLNRWSDTSRKCTTATAAKNVLWNKFGKTPIWGVCKSKSGSFLVATAPTYKGRNFTFPR
jgi:hypothetical protein